MKLLHVAAMGEECCHSHDSQSEMTALDLGKVINYSFGALVILCAWIRNKNRSDGGGSSAKEKSAGSEEQASTYR